MGDKILRLSGRLPTKSIYFKSSGHQKKYIRLKNLQIVKLRQMNARDFFYLVAEMREAQKAYFETKDRHVFRAARKLENEVDKEIKKVRLIVSNQADQT